MIMARGSDQLLLPVNPFFIALTLLAALLLEMLPVVATRPRLTCWPWCWCSGTCTSRGGWGWASPLRSVW